MECCLDESLKRYGIASFFDREKTTIYTTSLEGCLLLIDKSKIATLMGTMRR